ncbi:MAG TPA: glycosyltransferase family 4 protein [Lacunisphaera sp.]|nr:glycosyltransferase family 4 protein [Lacunisphaera sp.]
MRAAHILRKYVPSEWGGTETALQGLTAGLAVHGIDSVVYHPMAGPIMRDPLADAGCEMRPFRAHLPILGLSAAERQRMMAIGGNLLSFELPRLLAREPDLTVINSHVLGRLGGAALAVARRRNIPFVVTIHGGVYAVPEAVKQQLNGRSGPRRVEWGQLFGWWWRARHVLADADAIITPNVREAELLRERYPGQVVVVQPHGVNTEVYRRDHRGTARAAFPQVIDRDVLLCVARIDPVKNQHWLVQQLPPILARHPRTLLVLVGACTNAEFGANLEKEIRRLGLADKVLLTGGVPPGDPRLSGLMQLARAAILPSLNETFGLVILEAWAAGLPMLANRSAGSVELLRDGENGCLFDVAQPQDFQALLERVLSDTPFREHLTRTGRSCAGRYDTVAMAGQVKQLYVRLSEEKKCTTSFYAMTTPAR